MRHNKKGRKLGTDYSHTKAMKRSLVSALFLNDRIKTVESRAKEIRPQVDKVITWAKRGDLHSRRLAISYLNDMELVRETAVDPAGAAKEEAEKAEAEAAKEVETSEVEKAEEEKADVKSE